MTVAWWTLRLLHWLLIVAGALLGVAFAAVKGAGVGAAVAFNALALAFVAFLVMRISLAADPDFSPCPNCGAPVPDDDKKCPRCGYNVSVGQ
jgi:hypothetical protein